MLQTKLEEKDRVIHDADPRVQGSVTAVEERLVDGVMVLFANVKWDDGVEFVYAASCLTLASEYPSPSDVRDMAPTCVFHAGRAAVRNGMCEPCAEMADDAR